MPETTQIIQGLNRKWILKDPLDKGEEKEVWSAYDFSLYLQKAGLREDHIVINPMTRTRFLQECISIFRDPEYAVRFMINPAREALERFAKETEALGGLNDPRIVRIYDYDLDGFTPEVEETAEEEGIAEPEGYPPFYVMDRIKGVTLDALAEEQKAYEGKVHEALAFMKDIGLALVKAHKAGIIHQDLKPKNIFVREDGTPVIIDFGICHFIHGQRLSLTGEHKDREYFMPPELVSLPVNQENLCPANDVYSFGKLLYYLISGGRKLPKEIHHEDQYDLRKNDTSRPMELVYRILDRTITPDLNDRVKSIEELLGVIDREMQEGTTCIFCKKGKYRPISRGLMFRIWHISGEADQKTYEPRLLVCDNCGNIQNFCDTEIIEDDTPDQDQFEPIPEIIETETLDGEL